MRTGEKTEKERKAMTIRLLLVDDERDFRDAAGQALRRQGFQVSEAESGEHALELVPLDQPDLVILDLRMEGMDGIATLEAIRAENETLPVIILTGHGTYETALAGIHLGVVDFLEKPVDMRELGDHILGLIETGARRPLAERRRAGP